MNNKINLHFIISKKVDQIFFPIVKAYFEYLKKISKTHNIYLMSEKYFETENLQEILDKNDLDY